jgi:uncharacterized membrane protein
MIFTYKFWHQLFEAGVFLKAVNSVWETASGALLLLSANSLLHIHFFPFVREEFLGGRGDQLFRLAAGHLNAMSVSTKNFIGAYLLLHGLLNMFLAYNLYKNRLWAYPFAIGAVSLFLVYQIYRLLHTHSLILLCVTVFDMCFVYLTWREYIHQKNLRHH